jgi:hypothetical protein
MSESLFPYLGGADYPADSTVIPCPKAVTNWIDLEYLYADGTGVAGAAYVVQMPNGGQVGGRVLAQGILDSKGQARACLPVGIENVEVYFHKDPEGEPYSDPDAGRPVKEPEPGFFERIWNGISDGAEWVGGMLAGDFKEDPSTAQIIVNTIVTMIPVVDQVGDARDIVANLKKLIWDRRWNEAAVWLGVLLCLIGLIPELGSLAKGIIKVVLRNASKLADLLAVFNFFKKGHGVHWLREFAQKLPNEHATAAANKLKELLERAASYLRGARERWLTSRYVKPSIDRILSNIEEVKKLAPQKLREAAESITNKIEQAIDEGMERVMPSGVKRKLRRRQVKENPNQTLSVAAKRRNELSVNPQTKKVDTKSVEEADAILDAEARGIVSNARRPDLDKGEPNLDFIVDGGYADVKTPRPLPHRPIPTQAKDIVKSTKKYDDDVTVVVNLKYFDAAQKQQLKAELLKQGADMKKVRFVGD